MRRESWRRLWVAGLALPLAACATALNGRTQAVEIRSDPSGAAIEIDGEAIGETPATVELKRKATHDVHIHKAGHRDYDVRIQSVANDKMMLDAFVPFAGPIFTLIDGLSGGAYELEPPEIDAELEPEAVGGAAP